ncbi:ATP-binding protein [Halopseudomonas pelagia]|uniref:ATP-binding protein n=1 Tax=Halopseudomonas pelagia TaxID=553151 RepID=UPI0030DA757F
MPKTNSIDLRSWMWRAFVQSALIPLLLVETVLVAAYLLSNTAIRDAQIEHLRMAAQSDMQTSAAQEARLVNQRLKGVGELTRLYAGQVRDALAKTDVLQDPREAASLKHTETGVLYSHRDEGRAASFYSNRTPVNEQDLNKVMRLAQLDGLMQGIEQTNSLVSAIYFNTHDSYNRIWPWFFTPDQYPHDMDIPRYNFYYLADAENNPAREVVWTDTYVDPAGQGWMMSALAPVYAGAVLEGVVGLDITISSILQEISSLAVPWGGYAMLVSQDMNIMVLPEAGEQDLGLDELTQFSYDEAVRREIFKPGDFNLTNRNDTRDLAALVASESEGVMPIQLGGRSQLAAWSNIPETGWKLITLVDEASVFSRTNALASHYRQIGFLLIAGLVLFYLVFFTAMWVRARQLSQAMQAPIRGIGRMMQEIGEGNWYPEAHRSRIKELDAMALDTSAMGGKLADSEYSRQQATRHLERVLDSTTESIWEVDVAQKQIQFQGRLTGRFGLPTGVMRLDTFLQRVHPDDLNAARSSLMPRSAQHKLEAEYRLRDAAGDYHWLLGRGRIVEMDGRFQRPQRIAGTHVDIDAIKATQEALRTASLQAQSASLAKSRFLSSMSHELRTPLNAIQGFAQLLALDLEQQGVSPAQRSTMQQQVQEILQASQHLCLLVDDVLDLARIESERPVIQLESVDAWQLLLACAEQVRPQREAAGLILHLDTPQQQPMVLAEPRRLRQILLNLLSNAVKYHRPGGSITLDCLRVGARWQLRVTDNGLGIRHADQVKLFKPFQRLGHENSTIKGTGIGLALSRELASLMDGEMGFSSEPGVGSCFWVTLPEAPVPGAIEPGDQAQNAPGLLDVIYVEDDRSSQILVQHALAGVAQVTLIHNGLEALHRITQRPPQVLLLDIDLPDMQGDRLLRSLRGSARTRDLPVIVISAGALPADRERVSDLDVAYYLTKPLQIQDLLDAVSRVRAS